MAGESLQDILKRVLADNPGILLHKDKLCSLLDGEIPGRLRKDYSAVEKAIKDVTVNAGEIFAMADRYSESEMTKALGVLKDRLILTGMQADRVQMVCDCFAYALPVLEVQEAQSNSSANQVQKQEPSIQNIDDISPGLRELLSERENDIRNLPNVNYWISDLYSQMKKYNAEIEKLKKRNDGLEEENERLNKEIQKLNEKFSNNAAEVLKEAQQDIQALQGLEKHNGGVESKVERLNKELQELNEKLSNKITVVLKQDRKDIQKLQGKLKKLEFVNKGQANARLTLLDKSINTRAAEPTRKRGQEALKLIRDNQISANDAQFETYRGPISDFCRDYNALFSLSGSQRQQVRREYLSRYSVRGASFDENSGTLKETDIYRAEYYLYQRAAGVYEVVPTDKEKYEQEKHKRRGGESFFESNFQDYNYYSRITVIAPAVFSADLSLRQKGKLQLS